MSSEEELNSFEAELAALRPRSDRLDRDRLMFLAGRASIGGKRVRHTARVRFWPAATATMTAAAAVLLVALVVSPRVEIVERIVEVPAAQSPDAAEPPRDEPTPRDVDRRPRPDRREIESQPVAPPSRLAVALAGWLPSSDAPPPSLDSYPRLRDAVLARGLDSLPTTLPSATGGGRASDAVPSSYRNLRESLLEKQPAGKPSNRPARGVPFFSGAHS